MKNIFETEVTKEVIGRINALNTTSTPQWGKMNVGQMLAHCSVPYEMAFDDSIPKAKGLKKWMFKTFIKAVVVGEKPYKKNNRTAPEFIISDERDFDQEKSKLIDFVNKTQQLGAAHFDGKESVSFGALTKNEWNNLFYKHLDHHLQQFNV